VGRELDLVRQNLGVPYYENESILLYHGDCLQYLRRLSEHSVRLPLTVTSPPYNIGKSYENPLPLPAYLAWCEEWLKALWDITSANGALWLNLGYVSIPGRAKAIPLPYLLWERLPFFLIQEVVWHYSAGVASRNSLSPRNEKFLWCTKDDTNYVFNLDAIRDPDVKYPNQRKNGRLKVNALGKNPADVWLFPKVTSGQDRSSKERTPHPAQFPVALIERIVTGCSHPGDLLLDPFMGSGTVAEVAMRMGRQAVGFEIREDYLAIAADRLENVKFDLVARLPLAVDS
jgi:adenine-specific DNA-methyltransferase